MAIYCSYIFIILQKSMYELKPINSFFCCLNFSVVTCSALVALLASWAVTLDSFITFIMKTVKFPWDTQKTFEMAATRQMSIAHPLFQGPSDASGMHLPTTVQPPKLGPVGL